MFTMFRQSYCTGDFVTPRSKLVHKRLFGTGSKKNKPAPGSLKAVGKDVVIAVATSFGGKMAGYFFISLTIAIGWAIVSKRYRSEIHEKKQVLHDSIMKVKGGIKDGYGGIKEGSSAVRTKVSTEIEEMIKMKTKKEPSEESSVPDIVNGVKEQLETESELITQPKEVKKSKLEIKESLSKAHGFGREKWEGARNKVLEKLTGLDVSDGGKSKNDSDSSDN